MKLFIGFGHTPGIDPGTTVNSTTEVAQLRIIHDLMDRQLLFTGIIKIPWIGLKQQIRWLNAHSKPEDIAVQFHFDSGVVPITKTKRRYFGIYHSHSALPGRANDLKKVISEALVLQGFTPSGWVRSSSTSRFKKLGFTDDTTPNAFIIELGISGDPGVMDTIIPAALVSLTRPKAILKPKVK